jgi:hypothetical protein
MLRITTLWNAISTLAGNVQALAGTVAEVNVGLHSRLQLDGQREAPALPGTVLDNAPDGNGHPVAKRGRRGAD